MKLVPLFLASKLISANESEYIKLPNIEVGPVVRHAGIPPRDTRKREPRNFVSNNGFTCGAAPGANRIVGGFEVNDRSFPWQVSARLGVENCLGCGGCGGTIITTEHVLTAAHCSFGKLAAWSIIVAGLDMYDNSVQIPSANWYDVTAFHDHPSYNDAPTNGDPFHFDITVVQLSRTIAFDANQYPACLPPSDQCLADDQPIQTSGYGNTVAGTERKIFQLKGLDTVIDKNADCDMKVLGRQVSLNNICIEGKEGQTHCKGDSGGPMVWKDDSGVAYVLGITSYSLSGCGRYSEPLVYERVSRHLEFITEKTGMTLPNYSDITPKVCVENHISNFGTGLFGTGTSVPRRISTINDEKYHIKLFGDDTKCMGVPNLFGRLFADGQAIEYATCSDDYRFEWVHNVNGQIVSAGDHDNWCWQYSKILNSAQKEIRIKPCTNDGSGNQKFYYSALHDAIAVGKGINRQFVFVNDADQKLRTKKFTPKPQSFRFKIMGKPNNKEYQIMYTQGKVRNRCFRRNGNHLKAAKCSNKPYKNQSGFRLIKNMSSARTVDSVQFKARFIKNVEKCLELVTLNGKRMVRLGLCNDSEDQKFSDVSENSGGDKFKLCRRDDPNVCIGYNSKSKVGQLAHKDWPEPIVFVNGLE